MSSVTNSSRIEKGDYLGNDPWTKVASAMLC